MSNGISHEPLFKTGALMKILLPFAIMDFYNSTDLLIFTNSSKLLNNKLYP
jgi:hypothetical protein